MPTDTATVRVSAAKNTVQLSCVVELRRQICYHFGMTQGHLPDEAIADLGRKYLWWKPVDEQPFSEERIVAQTMNLGTYEDILLLERLVGRSRLLAIMLSAEPGWLSDRSWEFWRGRLSHATGTAIPDEPPRRSFDAVAS
jgi:hypothetical protein